MAAHVRQRRRQQQIQRLRRPRLFKDRSNPLETLEAGDIFYRFRFMPETILFILGILPNITRPTVRNNPLPPVLQLLVTLRFLATGSSHVVIGDTLNISREATGNCIRSIAEKLCLLRNEYVKFPTRRESAKVKQDFATVAGFPNVIGCIDGTHVKIIRPRENEADFVNRKGYHSLNVQMCCNASFLITSLVAKWPGSVHDSRIFRDSALCNEFENGQHDGILLGDSGYPLKTFLLTPFLRPSNPAEERYNDSLCRTRVLIEQTYGLLKRRFQCLHNELCVSPQQAVKYVTASVVLHNIGILRGDIAKERIEKFNIGIQNEGNDQGCNIQGGRHDGTMTRRRIVDQFFV